MKPIKQPAAKGRAPLTMADLVFLVERDTNFTPLKRRDVVSSIKSFVRCLDRDLALPADFMTLRQLLKRCPTCPAGIGAKRWSNIKSDVKFALAHYGAPTRAPLASHLRDEWAILRSRLNDIALQRGLSQLLHWCSKNGIAPIEFDDANAARFLEHLETATFEKYPERKFQRICTLWNRAVERIEGWPEQRLVIPCRRKRVAFPIGAFPASFAADLELRVALVSGCRPTDSRSPPKVLRPKTIAGQQKHILRFASALVRSGYPIERLTSLASLVVPANFKAAVQWYYDVWFGGARASLGEIAHTMVTIAKHYVRVPKSQLDELTAIKGRLQCRKRGMTEGNRERLRPFLQDDVQYRWLGFADRLISLSKKATSPKKTALLIQVALVHDILIMAPMRWENLVGLNLTRHFRYSQPGRKGTIYITILGDEVKNGEHQEFELPPLVAKLLRDYVEIHRPILLREIDEGWLFPGAGRGPKHEVTLRQQLTKMVEKHLGLKINPHLYRHVAAFFYLQAHPEDLETVRRLLGHKSIDTTSRYYADFNRATSIKLFQRYLTDREEELGGKLQDRNRQGGKRRGHS